MVIEHILKFLIEFQETYRELCRSVLFPWFVCFCILITVFLSTIAPKTPKILFGMSSPEKYIALTEKLTESWLLNIVETTSGVTLEIIELKWVLNATKRHVVIIPRQTFDQQRYFFSPQAPPPHVEFLITILQPPTIYKYFKNSANAKYWKKCRNIVLPYYKYGNRIWWYFR